MEFTSSKLATYINLSPNVTSPRNHAIDTITIHCFVGQVTAKSGCNASHFTKKNALTGASCNYVVGYDGSIGICALERDRTWCSSNRANDMRAVTIEVASDTVHPYTVTESAYKALIKLCADICQRNGIKRLIWSNNKADRVNHKNGCNMTVHRDFKNKACPGEFLYSRMGAIADEVNSILGGNTESVKPTTSQSNSYKIKVNTDTLNVRTLPSTTGNIVVAIHNGEIYTIVEEKNGWGKLKSGAGWISLKYTVKV